MFDHILAPTDGSMAAVRATIALAEYASRRPGAKATVVMAIHPYDAAEVDFGEEMVAAQNAKMRDFARRVLETAETIFKERDVPVETKVLEGQPVSAVIAREAAEGGYDLIAMASRGLGMEKDDLHYLGSVTEHVIRRVRIPVLVFPVRAD